MKFAITPVNSFDPVIFAPEIGIWLVGAPVFSLRTQPNFTYEQIERLNEIKKDKKIYVYVNALIEQHLLEKLQDHLEKLRVMDIDGVIFQDFAVYQLTREMGWNVELVYHPDTLNTNYASLNIYHGLGIGGAFLAREISLAHKQEIKANTALACFVQIHGCEYMAYSKRHLVSNYLKVIDKQVPVGVAGGLTIKANNIDAPSHIYEDEYGTHILSENVLSSIDNLDEYKMFDYGIIDNQFLDDALYCEVVKLYIKAMRDSGDYLEELKELDRSISYYKSFTYEKTVYRIDDVRRIDDEKANQ